MTRGTGPEITTARPIPRFVLIPTFLPALGNSGPRGLSRAIMMKQERARTDASTAIDDLLNSGFYPRIHDQHLEPRQVLGDYVETYVETHVERDLRAVTPRLSRQRPKATREVLEALLP